MHRILTIIKDYPTDSRRTHEIIGELTWPLKEKEKTHLVKTYLASCKACSFNPKTKNKYYDRYFYKKYDNCTVRLILLSAMRYHKGKQKYLLTGKKRLRYWVTAPTNALT